LAVSGLLAVSSASAQTFVSLHTFSASDGSTFTNQDGSNPWDTLLLSGNTLYGTANQGGFFANGAIFAVNTDGTGFTNLHSFTGNSDGGGPYDPLIISGNTLYGTSDYGGANGWGGIFKINTDGTGFTNFYSFPLQTFSDAGLVLQSNILYGVTKPGSGSGFGKVFAVQTDGSSYTNLHVFSGSDGDTPYAALILSSNVLYGTTYAGGSGYGTVFAIHTDGTGFTNLYLFTGGADGARPQDSLILSGNTLYGTTSAGGNGGASGSIFAINTDGTGFTNLYNFSQSGATDGNSPSGGLILNGGVLYGTATDGGSGASGTVFSVNTNGTGYTTLYSFTTGNFDFDNFTTTNADGANPFCSLILSNNTLYGTTEVGGAGGNGTVFKLILPGPLTLNMTPTNGSLAFSWPSYATSYVLQQSSNLSISNWMTSTLPVADDGTTRSVQVNPTNGSAFFRLFNTNSP
jgi:uncharacterized repeat protein (TIGR03803 family)